MTARRRLSAIQTGRRLTGLGRVRSVDAGVTVRAKVSIGVTFPSGGSRIPLQ